MAFELDCRGLACPEPVIRCRGLLARERPASLRVLVDNSAAVENVGRFLSRNGYSTESASLGDGAFEIRASDAGAAPEPAAQAPSCRPSAAGGKTVVLITTETLGRGDDVLGASLMGNFLATLPEMQDLWRVVLLNGGVKLACREGKALDGLRALADAGVGVFVCGTCLAHYGLAVEKRVGETTNMLDIVTSLSEAGKVVRP